MPWDNSVNKIAHIYAIATTIDVKNIPLTNSLGSISLPQQTGFAVYNFLQVISPKFRQPSSNTISSVLSRMPKVFSLNGYSLTSK